MSYTVIYGIKLNGDVVFVSETDNAFRGAMHVWMQLCDKYNISGSLFEGFDELWKIADKGILDQFENIVLKSTFDNVVVMKDNIPMLLDAFREYDKMFSGSTLHEQAEIIEKDILINEDMIGVCWNQTSVNGNPWTDGHDEDDEEIPYNTSNGAKHWFLTASEGDC